MVAETTFASMIFVRFFVSHSPKNSWVAYLQAGLISYELSERRRGRNAGKKAWECCKIFEFDSPSRQFVFNALS